MDYDSYFAYNYIKKKIEKKENNQELFYKNQIKNLAPNLKALIECANISKKEGYCDHFFKRNEINCMKLEKDKEGKYYAISLNNQLYVNKFGNVTYKNEQIAKELLPSFLNRFRDFNARFFKEYTEDKEKFIKEWEME